jgi:hypothetical protein
MSKAATRRSRVARQRAEAAKKGEADRRWIAADFSGGFVLLENEALNAVTEFSLMWSDLMDLRLVPVIEDGELLEVLARGQ